MRSWKAAGINVVVSALTDDEIMEMDLQHEADLTQANGLGYLSFPIVDRGIPESVRATVDLARRLGNDLWAGKKIAIHCRQGVGRSALLAACLVVSAGEDSATAFDRIGMARGCAVPDMAEQREWVARFDRTFRVMRPE